MSFSATSPTKETSGVTFSVTSRRSLDCGRPTTGSDEGNSSRDFEMNRLAVHHFRYRAPTISRELQNVIRRGIVDRMVHAPRIGVDRTVYFIQVPRLECRRCERVLTAALPNVVPQCNYTKSLARLVVDLRKMMTIRDVAQYLGVGEGMIRGIDKKYLQKHFSKPRLKDLGVIAIDELNVGRK